MDPAGMILLLDKGTDIDEANSFLLLNALVFNCCYPHLEMDLQAIEVQCTVKEGEHMQVYRGRVALFFLLNLRFLLSIAIAISIAQLEWLLALLKALCLVGLFLNPRVGPITVQSLGFDRLWEFE